MSTSDDEEADIKAAIAMSLATNQSGVSFESTTHAAVTQSSPTPLTVETFQQQTSTSGFAGLDRKAMEEERLARISRKRERSISPPPPRKAPKLEGNTISLPSGAKLTSFSAVVNGDQQARKSAMANQATEKLKSQRGQSALKHEADSKIKTEPFSMPHRALKYPNGVVKKTWAFGFDRTNEDIKLEEVLEPNTLRIAVLSAFQWSTEWILSKLKTPLNGGSTKCVFVMQAKEDDLRQQMMKETEGQRSFLRLCFPPMDGQIHCMHSKLMLLFHPDKLRVAIPSANLLDFDWGETGVMENSVFIIDLPRLPDAGKSETDGLTQFGQELMYYIGRQGLDQDVMTGVLNFDFSATEHMRFVHTVGGMNYGGDGERTGLPGLARAVRELSLQTTDGLEIDFAASSIGSLNDAYLRSLHAAACGDESFKREEAATSKVKSDFFKPSANKVSLERVNIREKMRIYFPTHETVTSSRAGAAGTICLSRKWWEAGTFPRSCFRDYRSTRTGLLSHNKILYARGKQKEVSGVTRDIAWAYVGSANMSESAWGKLVYDKKEKVWKVNCRNWECGVLLPVPSQQLSTSLKKEEVLIKKERVEGEDSETESEPEDGAATNVAKTQEMVDISVFNSVVRPPFEIPGQRFGTRQPWYFMESKS